MAKKIETKSNAAKTRRIAPTARAPKPAPASEENTSQGPQPASGPADASGARNPLVEGNTAQGPQPASGPADASGALNPLVEEKEPAKRARVTTYGVTSPLRFNGEKYAIGATVDMSPDEAAVLINTGILAAPAAK
jgi:hypothetical protein